MLTTLLIIGDVIITGLVAFAAYHLGYRRGAYDLAEKVNEQFMSLHEERWKQNQQQMKLTWHEAKEQPNE